MGAAQILCMGDSITRSSDVANGFGWGTGGYRGYLSSVFATLAVQYQFIGSQIDTNPDLPPILGAHEGRNGWMTTDWLSQVAATLAAYPPSIVILMIGTNDMIGGASSPATQAAAPANLEALCNAILGSAAAPWLLLCTIPTTTQGGGGPAAIAAYNSAMRIMSYRLKKQGKKIVYFDTGAAIGTHLFDGVHPDGTGYSLMANVLLPQLQAILQK